MIHTQLYDQAKIREQEYILAAARRNRNRANGGILAGVARKLRRRSGSREG
jgi:hypothetical protein